MNRSRMAVLKAEIALLLERKKELEERLRNPPAPGDLRSRRRKARWYWTLAAVLTAAGFYFTVWTFEPYCLGPKAYVYCLGAAITVAFLGERLLVVWNKEKFFKMTLTVGFLASISAMMFLAGIRGSLLI